MRIVEDRVGPVVECVAKTVALAATRAEKEKGEQPAITAAEMQYANESVKLDDLVAPITFLTEGEGLQVFQTVLDAYYYGQKEKGDIMEALGNAAELLMKADQQVAPGISISLCFAAIEAIVCEKDESSVNKQVKRHVATLLIPDANLRKTKEKIIDKLYNVRCEVMHGHRVNVTEEEGKAVRRLATGVVRAVVHWRTNQQRSGGITSRKELLDELNAASRKPAVMVGVPDLSDLVPEKKL
jgi:hypothetical protein